MDSSSNKRQYWGKQIKTLPPLNLNQLQLDSYRKDFLEKGIANLLKETSPIKDVTGKNFKLEFLSHRIGSSKNSPKICLEKGLTFEAPLKVKTRLTNLQTNISKDQEVFLGDIPMMSASGTFIINGVERVVVNQLVRSPGVFFTSEIEPHSGRSLHNAEIRPMRGSWLEFSVSKNDHITVKIDRHRKISATTFLRALGATTEEIKQLFKDVDIDENHPYIESTLIKDTSSTTDEALLEFYQKIRPGEPAVLDNAKNLLQTMFLDNRRYDLGLVGRYKLNKKLGVETPIDESHATISKNDVVAVIRYLINLQNGHGKIDDIDHLANRRIRGVGELITQTAFRIGLIRLERSIREKMSLAKTDESHTPAIFVNARPVIASISEFFRRNRLSTILDQVNPLSEVDNLRRLSVLGTGGITKERASFSMRDINASQYSRICPIRSPEGQNIGLVTYLSLYVKINEYGFMEAPYLKVKNGKVTDELVYLTADDESNYYITLSDMADSKGVISKKWVPARYDGQFIEVDISKIQFIDAVSRQVVGTSASLIPFVQHDDGTRALMGSNMQCQAVPLLKPDAPLSGTGMESEIASAMGWTINSPFDGKVVNSDSNTISIKLSPSDAKKAIEICKNQDGYLSVKSDILTYNLKKYHRTAQSTCYNQKPSVRTGDSVKVGDLLVNGPSAEKGELALGQNLLIAYGAFEGLGYEDAIIISEKLLKNDKLSSIYINEYTAEVMDTKLGPEVLTNDIPNIAESDLRFLDKEGVVTIGATVSPGDILVGKIAPRGETELSAEERLLRAIFGEKAREVKDTSLRMPHGDEGTVIDVQILDRNDGDELDTGVLKQIKIRVAKLRKITAGDKVAGRHGNKGVISKVVPEADMPYLADGTPIDIMISPLSVLARMNLGQLKEAQVAWAASKLNTSVAAPVFENIPESMIDELVSKAGLPSSGKAQLFDGRTGEKFEQETAVGVSYILKLTHMVEDKAHARSTGPYSIVTQQPLGGKAQMGGQRIGEMEVWALEAHKAAHVLREMLTIKSDDVTGRSKAFEAMVKGEPIPDSTLPESFKVLVKELNSLCLNIIPIDSTGMKRSLTDDTAISDKNQKSNDDDDDQIPSHVSTNIIKED
jgi:DNA-directed RNA polymerase subunit beta